MTPKRIQRKRTKGWRMPPNTVYVGRPTKWGNPFTLHYRMKAMGYDRDAAGKECAAIFRECLIGGDEPMDSDYAERIERMRRDIVELRGKDLACWCPLDKPCHADVLLELANQPQQPESCATTE
jgi:hypothetical protein